MAMRIKTEIYSDLIHAGVDANTAKKISMAAGLKHQQAYDFVKNYRIEIGAITEQQQRTLFDNNFSKYIERAKTVYNVKTKAILKKPRWGELHPAIRQLLIDMVYQEFEGKTAMPAATHNNIKFFVKYLENTPELQETITKRKYIFFLAEQGNK